MFRSKKHIIVSTQISLGCNNGTNNFFLSKQHARFDAKLAHVNSVLILRVRNKVAHLDDVKTARRWNIILVVCVTPTQTL